MKRRVATEDDLQVADIQLNEAQEVVTGPHSILPAADIVWNKEVN